MGGRPPSVSDVEILELFMEASEPFLFTSEVAQAIDMTQQGAFTRLEELEEMGYVESKSGGNARGWWITHAGRQFAKSESA